MTTHKTISTLSIAAIALLAAAAPSLAQVQSEQSSKDRQGSVAAPAAAQTIGETLASNRELAAATASRVATTAFKGASVNNAARNASPFKLSASAFKAPNHFTSAESSRFVNQRVNFNDAGPGDPNAKKQFRADDDASDSSRTKRFAFVPSRGQKLPE